MAITNADIKTALDVDMRAVINDPQIDSDMLIAFPTEQYTGRGQNYGFDVLRPVGKHNVGAGGSLNTKTAAGTLGRSFVTINPQLIDKEIIFGTKDFAINGAEQRQAGFRTHLEGMTNVALELTLTGQAYTFDGKLLTNDYNLMSLANRFGPNSVDATTGGWVDIATMLKDIKAAKERAKNISSDYAPDTLYISEKVWSEMFLKDATGGVTQGGQLRSILGEMGITRIFTDIALDDVNVIEADGSISNYGEVCALFRADPRIVKLMYQATPDVNEPETVKNSIQWYATTFSCGLHNLVEDGSVQIIRSLIAG